VDSLRDQGLPTSTQDDLEHEIAALIVSTLQLEAAPGEIQPEERLFGEGLGLDSIDALELALAISRRYGFELRSDDERNHQIFASLRSLARHVAQNRAPEQAAERAPERAPTRTT
jgi:acyl carrier protein